MCWEFLKSGGGRRNKRKGLGDEVAAEPHRHLTDEEMKALFKKHDGNGDGHLDKAELTAAFKELGSRVPGWRASQAIHENDLDLDGDIDYHEIDHLVSYVRNNIGL